MIDSEDNDLRPFVIEIEKVLEATKDDRRKDAPNAQSWKYQAASGMQQVLDQIMHKRKLRREGRVKDEDLPF